MKMSTEQQAYIRIVSDPDDDEVVQCGNKLIADAERVCFLGFSYHEANIVKLASGLSESAKALYGTAVGMGQGIREEAIRHLRQTRRSGKKAHTMRQIDDQGRGALRFLEHAGSSGVAHSARSRTFGSAAGKQHCFNLRGRFLLHAGQHVRVRVESLPRSRVSEALCSDLRVDACCEERSGVCMAQIVEPERFRQTSRNHHRLEVAVHDVS